MLNVCELQISTSSTGIKNISKPETMDIYTEVIDDQEGNSYIEQENDGSKINVVPGRYS